MQSLGTLIEERRKALGLTQLQLAEQVGLDRTHLAHVEGGGRTLTAAALVRVAPVLGVPVEQLTQLAADFERSRRAAAAPDSSVP